jgi:LDH2 family malate/lactate/ureidoglycolate dehydrogenase
MKRFHITYQHLRSFVVDVFTACDMMPQRSEMAAEVLCYADLHGFDTHGVGNLERVYVSGLMDGRINPAAQPEIVAESGAIAVIDGHDGLGLVVAVQAMDLAIAKAQEFGVGVVTVRRSSHFGSTGYYTSRALAADMLGIAMTNLGAQVIVRPPLGTMNMLGTNPISMAAPAAKLPPFLLDMSTSVVATGKIRAAQQRGEAIPAGWLVDDQGNAVTDPWAFDHGTGYLQLLGGGLQTGGHKGYGLALLVDILCGILSGAKVGPDPAVLQEGSARTNDNQNIGHFFLALNVGAFRPLDEFRQHMNEMLSALLCCPTRSANQRVIYPGYLEEEVRRERLLYGIPLDEHVYTSLCRLALRLGLAPPVAEQAASQPQD